METTKPSVGPARTYLLLNSLDQYGPGYNFVWPDLAQPVGARMIIHSGPVKGKQRPRSSIEPECPKDFLVTSSDLDAMVGAIQAMNRSRSKGDSSPFRYYYRQQILIVGGEPPQKVPGIGAELLSLVPAVWRT